MSQQGVDLSKKISKIEKKNDLTFTDVHTDHQKTKKELGARKSKFDWLDFINKEPKF